MGPHLVGTKVPDQPNSLNAGRTSSAFQSAQDGGLLSTYPFKAIELKRVFDKMIHGFT
jgi:hypothetical protein